MKFSLAATLLALVPAAVTTNLLRSSLLLALAVTLTISTGCGGPLLAIPGGELSGDVQTTPVTDWSFADDTFVDLEVRPGDPYSVELNYVVIDGQLYIDPAEGRQWFEYLRQDLDVRVRFGSTVYPVTAVLVGEPGEHSGFEGLDDDRFIYRLDSRPGDSP